MIKQYQKTGLQILAWLTLFAFLFSLSNFFHATFKAVILSGFDTVMLFIIYQITVHFLFPKFYTSSRYYLLKSIPLVLIFTGVYFLLDAKLMDAIRPLEVNKPPVVFHFIRLAISSLFAFSVATIAKLIDESAEYKENEKVLVKEKLETELKLLKAQINPHFIFNALNNIYSLSLLQSKSAPESVLKLSEMLRYVFYDCSKDKVDLSAEIKYIENFSAFQQMKSEFTQNIKMHKHIESSADIAPMLIIPFIENAFKYSRVEENDEAWVDINIESKVGRVVFVIENSVPENKPQSGSNTGIKNVQHRLDILYPGKYKLDIEEKDDRFRVNLSINLN